MNSSHLVRRAVEGLFGGRALVARLEETTASSPWQKCNFLNWDSRVSAKTEQR